MKLHITGGRVWLSGQFCRARVGNGSIELPAAARRKAFNGFFQVRRHKHEEDIAFRSDSGSHAEQRWLWLLQLVSSPGPAYRGLPAATASMQPLHHRADDIRRTRSAGRTLCAAATVVIGPVFIHGIASRTLAGIRREVERTDA